MRWTIAVAVLLAWVASWAGMENSLSAPTYYISAQADHCDGHSVRVWGASNLPPGSKLKIKIGERVGVFGMAPTSNSFAAAVDDSGFFHVEVVANESRRFRPGQLVNLYFAPWEQPANVVRVVGERGQYLGGLRNPQVGQLSGNTFALATDVEVGDCGPPTP